jgi:hypothetical protein
MTDSATTATGHELQLITNPTASDDGPPHILRSANAFALGMLPPPEPTYDLALLLQRNSGADSKMGRAFETVEACLAENQRRSSALLKAVTLNLPECSEEIDDLNEQLDRDFRGGNSSDPYFIPSRVSAIGMRELRLRFLGAVLKFVSANADAKASWVSMSHPDWVFGLNDHYWDEHHFPFPRLFRSLLRIGGVMTASGYLITYLHTLFDPTHRKFRLQYRGICAGEKLDQFRNLVHALADPKSARLVEDHTGLDPDYTAKSIKIGVHSIKNLPFELPGMMPQLPTVYAAKGASASERRTPEPYHSVYLRWAHLYRDESIVEMSGVALRCATFNAAGCLPLPVPNGASLSPVLD